MISQNFPAKSWIYNLADYRQIFALTDQDLQKKVLDFPGGISSVNAELYALGQQLVSADPAYSLPAKEMQNYARQVLRERLAAFGNQPGSALKAQWQHSTEQFLADYELGKKQQRYRAMALPPFAAVPDEPFELLLCADLLFTQELINELCKLATEVRIFPLPNNQTAVVQELGPMMLALQQRNFGVEIRVVNHPQRNHDNAMLRVWAKECGLCGIN